MIERKSKIIYADLHSHFWVTYEVGKHSLEKGPRDIKTVCDICYNKELDITGFTNCTDNRFSMLIDTAESLPSNYQATLLYRDRIPIGVNVVRDGKDKLIIVKSQEVKTLEGDLLVIGHPRNLEDNIGIQPIIQEAKDQKSIIVAPSPTIPKKRGGMGIKGLNNYISYWDAIEGANYQVPLVYERLANWFAEMNGIAMISVSDSHAPEQAGLAKIGMYEKPDATTGDFFISSLREIVRSGQVQQIWQRISKKDFIKWHSILVYDIYFRRKIGWL